MHIKFYKHECWAILAQGPTLMYKHAYFYIDPVILITTMYFTTTMWSWFPIGWSWFMIGSFSWFPIGRCWLLIVSSSLPIGSPCFPIGCSCFPFGVFPLRPLVFRFGPPVFRLGPGAFSDSCFPIRALCFPIRRGVFRFGLLPSGGGTWGRMVCNFSFLCTS